MKLFREVFLIFGIYFIGEGIHTLTSIPLPGSLIGMLLLFVLLLLRIIRLEHISTVTDFLLGHLPFFFIPAGVALMASFSLMQGLWIKMLVICLITTIITMGFSGKIIEYIMERNSKS